METTLDLCHNEFHFSDDNDKCGCCWFWRSWKKNKKELYVTRDGKVTDLNPNTTSKVQARIEANANLASLLHNQLTQSAVDENIAFDKLRDKINHNFAGQNKITEKVLIDIINALHEVKQETENENRRINEDATKR